MVDLNTWLDSKYLLVKDVFDNDIIELVAFKGIVDSFGKEKAEFDVIHNGKLKTLLCNKVQYRQLEPIRAGRTFTVTRISVNGGTALSFKPLN